MARVLLRSPEGAEHYPAIVVRSHVTEGAIVSLGDMLFEIQTAEGRNLGIRASRAGRIMSPPYPEGMTLHAQVLLAELEPEGAGDGGETPRAQGAKPDPGTQTSSRKPKEKARTILLRTPEQADLYPLTIAAVHVKQGASVRKGDTLYELNCARGKRIGIPSPQTGRLKSPAYPVGFLFEAPNMLAEIQADVAKEASQPAAKDSRQTAEQPKPNPTAKHTASSPKPKAPQEQDLTQQTHTQPPPYYSQFYGEAAAEVPGAASAKTTVKPSDKPPRKPAAKPARRSRKSNAVKANETARNPARTVAIFAAIAACVGIVAFLGMPAVDTETSGKSKAARAAGPEDFYLDRIGAKPLAGSKSRAASPASQKEFDDWINS